MRFHFLKTKIQVKDLILRFLEFDSDEYYVLNTT